MNTWSWLIIIGVIATYWFGKSHLTKLVEKFGVDKHIPTARVHYVTKVLMTAWLFAAVLVIGMVAGIDYRELGLFFTSVFAVIGIALFAQWSILSNITASIIVFFFFPYRAGDHVKILDGENGIEGEIQEISLFHVIVKTDDGKLATYPNSMAFQKAVIITQNSAKRISFDE
jgi:small-conductance mechanosensitive channel